MGARRDNGANKSRTEKTKTSHYTPWKRLIHGVRQQLRQPHRMGLIAYWVASTCQPRNFEKKSQAWLCLWSPIHLDSFWNEVDKFYQLQFHFFKKKDSKQGILSSACSSIETMIMRSSRMDEARPKGHLVLVRPTNGWTYPPLSQVYPSWSLFLNPPHHLPPTQTESSTTLFPLPPWSFCLLWSKNLKLIGLFYFRKLVPPTTSLPSPPC